MMKSTALAGALATSIVLMATGASACSDSYTVGDLAIESPWARATTSTAKTGGAFMNIKNYGDHADKLIAASSPVAEMTQVHRSFMEGEVMKMQEVKAIEVAGGNMVMLKPGSYHVMFMGLKGPLKMGDQFPLTLVFEKAGEVEVTVDVLKAGAMSGMKIGTAMDMKPSMEMNHTHQ